jgi:hypothetical protein
MTQWKSIPGEQEQSFQQVVLETWTLMGRTPPNTKK